MKKVTTETFCDGCRLVIDESAIVRHATIDGVRVDICPTCREVPVVAALLKVVADVSCDRCHRQHRGYACPA